MLYTSLSEIYMYQYVWLYKHVVLDLPKKKKPLAIIITLENKYKFKLSIKYLFWKIENILLICFLVFNFIDGINQFLNVSVCLYKNEQKHAQLKPRSATLKNDNWQHIPGIPVNYWLGMIGHLKQLSLFSFFFFQQAVYLLPSQKTVKSHHILMIVETRDCYGIAAAQI